MITAPQAFIDQIESGNRKYQFLITCTLTSGTVLTFQNDRIWSGGYSYDDALSTDPDTLEVGTAIINKLTLVINNMDEAYSSYDFGDAVLQIQIGLREDAESEISYISKGVYTVSDASYDTSLITLTALDNMWKFDTLYGTIPQVPSTALAIVQDACTVCGVTLGVQTFDGASTAITVAPTKDTTYRQMLAWIGQMVGCDWRINTSGELVPLWFNLPALGRFYDGGTFAYNDGDTLNGGTFAYNDGDDVDTVDGGEFDWSGYFVIKSLATANVAIDDTIITGITVRVENIPAEPEPEPEPEEGEEESPAVADAEPEPAEAFTDFTTGTPDFLVLIEGNPLITVDNAQTILTALAERLIGMRYRKGQLMHLSDPRLEAGDVFVYADHKGHAYPMICSQTLFTLGDYQTTTSASANPLRKAAERYSAQAQTIVQIYKSVFRERTLREQAEADLQEQLNNASGLYMTTESDGSGGTIYNLHDRPTKAESNIIWRMSASAVGVSTNGGQSYNAGLTADGTAIVQRLYSNTITAGIIQSPDYAYTSGNFSSAGMLVDLAHNVIRTPSFAVVGGNTYISTSMTLGGANNQNGVLTVKDASGNTVGTWSNTGINAIAGSIGALHISTAGIYSGNCNNLDSTSAGMFLGVGDSYSGIKINVDPTSEFGALGSVSIVPAQVRLVNTAGTLQSSLSYDWLELGVANPKTQYRNGSIEFTGDVAKATAPSATQYKNIVFLDNGGRDSYHRLAFIEHYKTTANENCLQFGVYNHMAGTSSNSWPVGMRFTINSSQSYSVQIWGNTTVSGSILTSSGRLYSRLASGEAQIQADNNNTNKIYMYANSSSGSVGIWQNRADGGGGAILQRANNTNVVTFGNGQGNVLTYSYHYSDAPPVVSNTTDKNRVSHFAGHSSYMAVVLQLDATDYSNRSITLSGSDVRLKDNIKEPDVDALPVINSIKMHSFDWKDAHEYTHQPLGMVADELEKIDPRFAVGGGYDDDGFMCVKSVDTFYLVGYLVKAVQELSAEIERMKAS